MASYQSASRASVGCAQQPHFAYQLNGMKQYNATTSRTQALGFAHETLPRIQDKHVGIGTSFGHWFPDVVLWARYERILTRDFPHPSTRYLNNDTESRLQPYVATMHLLWSDIGRTHCNAGSCLRRRTIATSLGQAIYPTTSEHCSQAGLPGVSEALL